MAGRFTAPTAKSPLMNKGGLPSSASTSSLLHGDLDGPFPSRAGTSSMSSHDQRPVSRSPSIASLTAKYSLAPSPVTWGAPLLMDTPEPDDYLHNPDPRRDMKSDYGGTMFTMRGLKNLGCLAFLVLGMTGLFAVYPIIANLTEVTQTTQGGFNLGGVNATGQIPDIPGNYGMIDKDTPASAYTKISYHKGEELMLVFSDEFEQDGRTFWPGDDPYWEAVDLHYWGTNDLEWHDPHQVTTKDGALQITLEEVPDPSQNHNMSYRGGMIQSWNKFCFTGGLIEVSVRLPGSSDVSGYWPGVWTMGNLGRAGYGASNEGLWPYSYDSCDVGTLANQTWPGTMTPEAAALGGDKGQGLSWLPGQRLSACTCPGESHPGPVKPDGTYVGRAAPEIDILEALVEEGAGQVSMSAQWAPFSTEYLVPNDTSAMIFPDLDACIPNPYVGGTLQQCTSGLGVTNQTCYQRSGGCFTTYGFEYKPGFDDSYITWWNNGAHAWTLLSPAMVPDTQVEIGRRPIPQEPMYIIMNVAISEGFGLVDFENLVFPGIMSVDYVRVYQPKDAINTGCDPKEFPTAKYIETYKGAYMNYNLTTWAQYNQTWPRNRLENGPDGVC